MAIDDNTIYGLYGSQIKDLAQRVKEAGAIELTTADYNYPTDSPTSVALWLLEPGIYTRSTADGVVVRYGTESSQTLANNENTVLVTEPTASGSKNYLVLASNNTTMKIAHSTSSGNEAEIQLILNASNVAQTTGDSTTNVMSQNAVTKMVFADPARKRRIKIGEGSASSDYSVGIGDYANTSGEGTVAIGRSAAANIAHSVAIGENAYARDYNGTIALGAYSGGLGIFTAKGMMHIGTSDTSYGYNSSNYRLLTGLYDPQSNHDAATKGYVDTAVDAKQDELTAGTGITIEEESGALVISATGGGADVFTTNEWDALWA